MNINRKMFKLFKIFAFLIIFLFFSLTYSFSSELIKKIKVKGNDRIPTSTVLMFADFKINNVIDDIKINEILKNIYDSNFFENVSVKVVKDTLEINVLEFPIIENIFFEGLKAKKNIELVKKNLRLKNRSSFNKLLLEKDTQIMLNSLKQQGYYFSTIDPFIEDLKENNLNIFYKFNLGKKAKIKNISFIGDKVFKDSKLRSIILSEEYKFWKFISGKKFLNEQLIEIDKRLIKNFYLNSGYFNVEVNSSFAKLIEKDSFELVYSINAKQKVFFDKVDISYPDDFNDLNFKDLKNLFKEIKGKPYSLNTVEKILNEIDYITINDEYRSIKATVDEQLLDNKLNINFNIEETEKFFVERINIYGNNVTRESVIRNQLEIDEGDIFNEILNKKSVNNLKNLNYFKNVSTEVVDGREANAKIINFNVIEKPTGDIRAGAGFGTSGGTFIFAIKENNYLGKGIALEANGTLTEESFKGLVKVSNPNFKNSDKRVFASVQAQELDRTSTYGYKSNKTGFELGTGFEYLRDLNLGLSTRSFYEKIETTSSASARQKKQEGDYWDTFVEFNFDLDKRNQKFKPTDGYRSFYSFDVPLISENNTLTNTISHRYYSQYFDNNVVSVSMLLKTANSITGDDVKLSERLNVPSNRLRGFERGKVGPKDGNDFIGGNYLYALNATTTIPQLFQDYQNLDLSLFFDAANVWGIDYDSSLSDSSKIRSSVGIGVDLFTPVGPMNFSLAETITKSDSDITESFRFSIGTTF